MNLAMSGQLLGFRGMAGTCASSSMVFFEESVSVHLARRIPFTRSVVPIDGSGGSGRAMFVLPMNCSRFRVPKIKL